VTRMNADIVLVLNRPEVKERFVAQGADASSSTPADFGQFIRSEIDKWRKVVQAAGLKAN